ncbi:MAG: hypothetical protein M3277_00485 [Actinomycetota bacterium]|nr:hypothetical protein [Actinomycetota bacterium]
MIVAGMFAAALAVGTVGGVAYGSDENAPNNRTADGAHPHHVHKGNADCENLDEVWFEREHRGMHRGANESGSEHGPWHGTCESVHSH